ncbi:DUF1223 domain-containing protein [Reyranella sp.]|uniref:DUF1223 domain-containing protein n=1 Tax=Reyranella sp. TaxID=1929291 RepID=UPI003D108E16
MSLPGRRSLLIAGAGLLAGRSAAAVPKDGPWSIELFTSQGCSSCPPADMNLGKLAARPDIVALSFHVDYWDYIGWKDRFASKANTERQHVYARTLKQRYVYTPEMVVDGRAHEPGVKEHAIEALLADVRRQSSKRATPKLKRTANGALSIWLAAATLDQPADVVVFAYDRRHSTPVERGENNGRRLDNFNVVRHFERVSRWDGAERQWTVPADRFQPDQGIAVLVQQADQGPVLGANKLELLAAG